MPVDAARAGAINSTHPHLAYLGEPELLGQDLTARQVADHTAAVNRAKTTVKLDPAAARPPATIAAPTVPQHAPHHAIQQSDNWQDSEPASSTHAAAAAGGSSDGHHEIKEQHPHSHAGSSRALRVPAFPGAYGLAAVANLSLYRLVGLRPRGLALHMHMHMQTSLEGVHAARTWPRPGSTVH